MSESAEPSNQSDSKAPDGNRKLPVDGNVAGRLSMVASLAPGAIAIAEPDGPPQPDGNRSYALTTFGALDQRSDEIAKGLIEWGVKPGMRIAMLVPFGAGFIELVFALMKAGVVTVLVDPGMGRKHLVRCLSDANPDGFMGIPKAQAVRTILRSKFPKAKWNVTVGRRYFWGGKTLQQIIDQGKKVGKDTSLPRIERTDEAAVIFTTGSTAPEGVLYPWRFPCPDRSYQGTIRHSSEPGSCRFPPWSFRRGDGRNHHHPGHGSHQTSPSQSRTFGRSGSPMGGRTGSDRLHSEHGCTLAETRNNIALFRPQTRTLSRGPGPSRNIDQATQLADPDANIMTPYGATEALPLASIESREVMPKQVPHH